MKDRYGNPLRPGDRVNILLEATLEGFPPGAGYEGSATVRLDLSPYNNPCVFLLVPTKELGFITKENPNATASEAEAHGELQAHPDPDLQV